MDDDDGLILISSSSSRVIIGQHNLSNLTCLTHIKMCIFLNCRFELEEQSRAKLCTWNVFVDFGDICVQRNWVLWSGLYPVCRDNLFIRFFSKRSGFESSLSSVVIFERLIWEWWERVDNVFANQQRKIMLQDFRIDIHLSLWFYRHRCANLKLSRLQTTDSLLL